MGTCLLSVFMLTSCSLFFPKSRQSNTPVKDVPYAARSGVNEPLRKRVLVLPFIDEKTGRSQNVTNAARTTVLRNLAQSRSFVLVKDSDFPEDLGKFITENREYDLERVAPIAASLGIAAVIEGKILEIKAKRIGEQVGIFREIKARFESTVRLRVLATRNSRIIMEDVRSGEVE